MAPVVGERDRYLLVFGATMALRERAVVAALRAFDGPLVTIWRTENARAAKFFDHVLIADFSDAESSLQAVLDFEAETGMTPAGVVPFFDPGLVPGHAIAEHYGLPYLSREAIDDSGINKNRMKDRLLAAGVPTPRYRVVDGPDDVRAAADEFGLPCVIKPSAFGGSLGVRLLTDRSEIDDAYAYVRGIIDRNAAVFTVRNHSVQVEEFCPLPDEVSVEVLNHHDERAVLAVTDKSVGPRPYFAEIGHRVPSVYSADPAVTDLALRACAAIGLTHGVAHVELRLGGDAPPQIMEVGARTAGDGIPDLVEVAYGISPYELHVRSYLEALPELPEPPEPRGLSAIAVLKAPPGRIEQVRSAGELDPAVRTYEVFAVPGAESHAEQANYLDREGYVELFWPGAEPRAVDPREHLEIAERMSGAIFAVSPPTG